MPRSISLYRAIARFSSSRLDNRILQDANDRSKIAGAADTGYFYVTKKNSRTKTEKMSLKKYDPVARKHVEFKETKIK